MGVAIACETAGGTGVGPAVIRYCFTYGFGCAMGVLRLALFEFRIDPGHHRAQLLALHLDLVALALGAHALEVLLTGAVLGDPLARERAVLDFGEDVLHRLAGGVGDDPLAAREVAVLGGVGD